MNNINKITRRKATEEDEEFARNTHHEAYRDVIIRQFGNFNKEMQDDFFNKSWQPENLEILLNNEKEIGYCSIENFNDHIYIHELVISPDFQGRGLGSAFLEKILGEATVETLPVRLQVLKENQAQNLYRKMGFKDAGLTDTHIQMLFIPKRHS